MGASLSKGSFALLCHSLLSSSVPLLWFIYIVPLPAIVKWGNGIVPNKRCDEGKQAPTTGAWTLDNAYEKDVCAGEICSSLKPFFYTNDHSKNHSYQSEDVGAGVLFISGFFMVFFSTFLG